MYPSAADEPVRINHRLHPHPMAPPMFDILECERSANSFPHQKTNFASHKTATPTSLRLAFAIHRRTPNSQTTKIPQKAELKGLICGECCSARKYLWVGNNKTNCCSKPVITVCRRLGRNWKWVDMCVPGCLLRALGQRCRAFGLACCHLGCAGAELDLACISFESRASQMCVDGHIPPASFQTPLCTCPTAKLGI